MAKLWPGSRWGTAVASTGTRVTAPWKCSSSIAVIGEGQTANRSSISPIAASESSRQEAGLPVVEAAGRVAAVEHRVQHGVRHRPELHEGGRAELPERSDVFLRPFRLPEVTGDADGQLRAGAVGRVHEARERHEVVGRAGREVPVETEELLGGLEGMRDEPADDQGAHRVEAELEGRDHPEVPAAAAQAPEQIGVLALGGGEGAAVRGDHARREEVVRGQAVPGHQPAEPAAQRQPGDAGRRDDAAGDGEAVELRLAVQLAPAHARLHARRTGGRVDVDALQWREVDRDAALADAPAGDAVTAPANRDLQARLAGEVDGGDDVGLAVAPRDQRGAPVDEAVVDASRLLVARLVRDGEARRQSLRGTQAPRLRSHEVIDLPPSWQRPRV